METMLAELLRNFQAVRVSPTEAMAASQPADVIQRCWVCRMAKRNVSALCAYALLSHLPKEVYSRFRLFAMSRL
jgi:hypothetical protein